MMQNTPNLKGLKQQTLPEIAAGCLNISYLQI
jgi:hypothetical protein